MSRFGINSVSIEGDSLFIESEYRDMYAGSLGLKYHTRPDLAFSLDVLYTTSPISNGKRTVGLPLDRTIVAGGGAEWQLSDDLVIKTAINYIDLGDGKVDHDGGPLTGAITGSFRDNYAIAFDLQVTKRSSDDVVMDHKLACAGARHCP